MGHRRFILLALVLSVIMFSVPVSAHASLLSLLGESTKSLASILLDVGSEALDVVSQLVLKVIAFMGRSLQDIISFKPTYGGATVYQMWKWVRDLCNMLFVVILVGIAFGTIFNTLKSNAFHYRSSLASFIVAAILINMSLAAGQTIIWAGNQATDMVLGFMPKDIGAQIANSLNTAAVATGQVGIQQPIPAATTGTSLDRLEPTMRTQAATWATHSLGQTPGTPESRAAAQAALTALQTCLENNQKTVQNCWQYAQNMHRATYQGELNRRVQTEAENSAYLRLATVVANVYYGKDTVGLSYGGSDLQKSLARFGGLLIRLFLLLVLALSFFAIDLFMVARIPVLWFLLALSSGAFFMLAVPFARANFSKWLKNIVGMSFFGPLYLMVIYLGLFVLNTQGSLVTAGNDVNDIPFVSTLFGTAFFYFIAAGIFIGGAAAVSKFCFNLSPTAGAIFGAIGGTLGISEKTGFGVKSLARGIGAVTGATTVARGMQEGVRERYERVIKKPLAARQERLETGVRTLVAGGEARQKYLQSRIDDRTKRLDQQIQKQTDRMKVQLEQATAAEIRANMAAQQQQTPGSVAALRKAQIRRANIEAALTDMETKQVQQLQSLMKDTRTGRLGVSNETAIAAGNQLMKLQKITPAELLSLQQRYAQVSPAALQGFIKQRNEQLQKDAGTRKYADAGEIQSFLQLITDKKQAGKFVDSAKTGKNKVHAIIAGANLGLIMGADGKTPLTTDEALIREARRFSPTDILKAEEHYQQTIGAQWQQQANLEEISNRYSRLLYDVSSFAEMRANATAQQLARVTQAEQQVQARVTQLSSQKAQFEAQRQQLLRQRPPGNIGPVQQQLQQVDQQLRAITEKPSRQPAAAPPANPQPAAPPPPTP